MKPVPPAKLERLLLLSSAEEEGAAELSELLTRLLLRRRTASDNKVAWSLRRGEGFTFEHIAVLVRHRLDGWWKRWEGAADGLTAADMDEDEAPEAEADLQLAEDAEGWQREEGEEEEEEEEEEHTAVNAVALTGSAESSHQPQEYTGPDFASFGPLPPPPLPSSFSFFSLRLRQRVVLLHCLCDDHLSFSPSFASTVRSVQPRDARIPPLAIDAVGHRYWFFGFADWRIYREDAVNPVRPRTLKQQRESKKQQPQQQEDGKVKDEKEEVKEAKEPHEAPAEAKAEVAEAKPAQPEEEERRQLSSSYSPGFHLLCDGEDGMQQLVQAMRKSPYQRDRDVSAAVRAVLDDLQQGKGRADEMDGDEEEGGEEEKSGSGGAAAGKKRRRGQDAAGDAADGKKRSLRLMLVMAGKQEEERQRQEQEEAAREVRRQMRQDYVRVLAQTYIDRTVYRGQKPQSAGRR